MGDEKWLGGLCRNLGLEFVKTVPIIDVRVCQVVAYCLVL